MEMLGVVAIITVLTAVAFVGVINYRRDAMQLELDATAKEIYIAAQNHLFSAADEGLLQKYSPEESGTLDAGAEGLYHFAYSPNAAEADGAKASVNSPIGDGKYSTMGLMLPFGSIEESVRLDGSYILRYRKETGRIVDVFYAKPQGLGGVFGSLGAYDFNAGNYSYEDVVATKGSEDENRSARRDFNGGVIGYYGGEDLKQGEALKRPVLQVKNGDELVAEISNPNPADGNYELKLIVEGKESHAKEAMSLPKSNSEVVLDSVTTAGKHFGDMFKSMKGFSPGEDIDVSVVAYRKDELAKVEWSATVTANSLFASVGIDEDEETGKTGKMAKISSFRHLENLTLEVSGVGDMNIPATNEDGEVGGAGAKPHVVSLDGAKQLVDLSWTDFVKNNGSGGKLNVYARGTGASADGAMLPVNPLFSSFAYNAQWHRITDAKIVGNGNADAGLFGTLENASVNKLVVVNCDVAVDGTSAGGGNAGALVGTATNCAIGNVLVYNDLKADGGKTDDTLKVSAPGNAGGLVGSMRGGSVESCAAAVYVASIGTSPAGSSAGGLVGLADNGAMVTKSYSGGHTKDGRYQQAATGAGHYNVQAEVEAGGLVGRLAGGAQIGSCYSTCSVFGATAGGFIGSMASGSVSSSYATGRVWGRSDASTIGAFVGSYSGGDFKDGTDESLYLKLINGEVPVAGSGSITSGVRDILDIEGAEADAEKYLGAYRAFANGTGKAHAYDSNLSDTFAYPTIAQRTALGEDQDNPILNTHYGDWQTPETYVVNKKSGF